MDHRDLSIRQKKNLTLFWIGAEGKVSEFQLAEEPKNALDWYKTLESICRLKNSVRSWNDTMKANKLTIPFPEFARRKTSVEPPEPHIKGSFLEALSRHLSGEDDRDAFALRGTSKKLDKENLIVKPPEPDYKAWVGLLLEKIKNHNEDLQRAKKLQGINPMDFAMGSFMGPRISYDNSPREIQLPSSIKEWQEKELESTEEGRKKIGKGALSKLTHQERRVLNLNRPFKVIDKGFLLHEVQVKENEATYKERGLELAAMYKQLQGLRKQKHGATQTDKYLKLQKIYDKMHHEFHAFKEAHLASCKFDHPFYE